MIIGLTGPNAAGKGEVAAHLGRRGYRVHSLSDIVRDEATRLGFAPEREHLIRIGNELRVLGGPGVLAERIVSRLGEQDVVDSIRNPAEVDVLRRLPAFRLLGVTAPSRIRFARSLARNRAGDPRTIEEFEAREREENAPGARRQQLEATFRLADRVVSNDRDLVSLCRAVEDILAEWRASAGAND